jgi:ATP adenylyltransferase/5',5'''-P-1,P-4-tetraphosphate phosphorylase II
LFKEKIFNDLQSDGLISQNDYASAASYFFDSQLKSWPLMQKNYEARKNIQTKSFWFEGMKLKVQFNPERIKSTSADVDESSIANRSCFLCAENLPEEQKGILFRDNFILLCNPYPIFPQHFTIAALNHIPQRISEYFGEFLELSKLLSPLYTLIYNGPACGASAPDHLHFQAGTRKFIPIENDIQQMKNDFGNVIQDNKFITTTLINDGLHRIIFLESIEQSLLEITFQKIFREYENLSSSDPEPMMNLLCSYDKEFGWNVIIFLRSKHRPECFYKNDTDRILISPAAVDMGGLIVTPREEDFIRTNKDLLQKIFNEVSLHPKIFSLLTENIKAELS